jgi:NADH-quinone oxidoreductase subunit C
MTYLDALLHTIQEKLRLAGVAEEAVLGTIAYGELTLEVATEVLLRVCEMVRDDPDLKFEMLMDVAGVDYLEYGLSEWQGSDKATATGFSRATEALTAKYSTWTKPRFAAVYHLLSLTHNWRLRIKTFASGEPPTVPSVVSLWNSANWYEREAFDLFGIVFEGHPDLRRILTDYGFIGHPFRKDFPLIGEVEMHYSAKEKKVIYAPVSIVPRTLVPKTIPKDNRYLGEDSN